MTTTTAAYCPECATRMHRAGTATWIVRKTGQTVTRANWLCPRCGRKTVKPVMK